MLSYIPNESLEFYLSYDDNHIVSQIMLFSQIVNLKVIFQLYFFLLTLVA